jgi:hypothetical protein
VGDLLCSNFTLEGETLVPQLRRPFRFLAEGFLNGEEGTGGGGGTRIELFLEGAVSLDRRALDLVLAA